MAAQIRIVAEGNEPREQSFAEAAEALLARALAEGANALVIAWESENGVSAQAIPRSHVVVRGLVDVVYEQLHPMSEEE